MAVQKLINDDRQLPYARALREVLSEGARVSTEDLDYQASLEYIETVYELYRAPESPEWDEMKPRVERYLQHLFSKPAVTQ